MNNKLKTLALVTTGLVVGVVLGRVNGKSLDGKYKTVTIDPNPTIVEIKNNQVFISQVLLGEVVTTVAHRIRK